MGAPKPSITTPIKSRYHAGRCFEHFYKPRNVSGVQARPTPLSSFSQARSHASILLSFLFPILHYDVFQNNNSHAYICTLFFFSINAAAIAFRGPPGRPSFLGETE
jgi:hypothetical protein